MIISIDPNDPLGYEILFDQNDEFIVRHSKTALKDKEAIESSLTSFAGHGNWIFNQLERDIDNPNLSRRSTYKLVFENIFREPRETFGSRLLLAVENNVGYNPEDDFS